MVVTNAAGEVQLILRSDNGNLTVPGGAIDLGESLVHAVVRETREETGIDCEVTGWCHGRSAENGSPCTPSSRGFTIAA